jgi:hypothetical protein
MHVPFKYRSRVRAQSTVEAPAAILLPVARSNLDRVAGPIAPDTPRAPGCSRVRACVQFLSR